MGWPPLRRQRALATRVADLGHADPDGRIRDDAAIGATEPDGPP
jgi:hypothetical protein